MDPATPSINHQISERDRKKAEDAAKREAEAAAKALDKSLRAALKEDPPSAEATALLAQHAAEAERIRTSIAQAERRKQQQEANATETVEDERSLASKITQLAELVRSSTHAVIYTGAGLSTAAAIPDYRGPQGLWTLAQKKTPSGGGSSSGDAPKNAPCAARQAMGQSFAEARPTSGHMAVAALVNGGHVRQVISQNVDGLHMRSGVPVSQLTELHGNVFRERCPSCAKEYLRGFDVTGKSSYHRHGTERTCERKACEQCELRDTIVYFGEKIYPSDLQTAKEQSEACDLAIFIGSSLKVLAHYAFIWQPLPKPRKKRIVIVNLQPTPKDKQADIRIFGRCDDVLERLIGALGLSMPSYQPDKDAVLKLAMALPPPPLPPPKPPSLPPPPPSAEPMEAESAGPVYRSLGAAPSYRGLGAAPVYSNLSAGGGSSDAAPSYSNLSAAAVPPSEPMGEEMEGEEVEEEAESPSMAFVPPKKRRKKALTYKKKALPRAFPAGAPERPPAMAPPPAVAAQPPEPEPAAEPPQPPPPPPPQPPPRAAAPAASPPAAATVASPPRLTRAGSADLVARGASPLLELPSEPPLSDRRKRAASPVASASSSKRVVSPAPAAAKVEPQKKVKVEAKAAAPAARLKCSARCGFFAMEGSEYCSKCKAKMEAEMSAWHGARSKKSGPLRYS